MPDDERLKQNLLIKVCTNDFLNTQFISKTVEHCWCCEMNMFQGLYEKALSFIIPKATTYL